MSNWILDDYLSAIDTHEIVGTLLLWFVHNIWSLNHNILLQNLNYMGFIRQQLSGFHHTLETDPNIPKIQV